MISGFFAFQGETQSLERRHKREIMKKQKGFSLIELLIVVAIILIIAAIAVPNLLRSRMAANESSAAGSSRTVATSNVTYATTYGIGFAGAVGAAGLDRLGPAAGGTATSDTADLLDSTLAAGLKSGYTFTYTDDGSASTTADPVDTYTLEGTPTTSDVTGKSWFCVDQTNVVRKDPAGAQAATGAGTACDDGTGVNPAM